MKSISRKHIFVQGIVQGVGFRPFVYREAMAGNLKGFVANTSEGVEIEVEGDPDAVHRFLDSLKEEPPVLSRITHMDVSDTELQGDSEFVIRSSRGDARKSTLISPDMSVCRDCRCELFDPHDRRFRYPFINCTNCGPRYTIIQDIPYDRPKTTMSTFQMCPSCQAEYDNPLDRRFHAQPNACSVCGPKVWLTDAGGESIPSDAPIGETVRRLRAGQIAAIKGIGGFHLACDAMNESAVTRLRLRKRREEKPLAVMVGDAASAEQFANVSIMEKDLLDSPRRPIVLLHKRQPHILAESVAPRNGYIGAMLPYTPLHYLLVEDGLIPVMTSGNFSEEPIAIDNEEALARLSEVADFFLLHDREIYLRSDDSVMRVAAGLPRPIRRSRGYVPSPVFLIQKVRSVLAVGGELKNAICLTRGDRAFLSQHIGDLENLETLGFFEECVNHMERILDIQPEAIAHDLHPDYLSTQWALKHQDIPRVGVQHHHAHIASCLAENGREDRVIGLALDGTGYGEDGCIWGGEVLLADLGAYDRVGYLAYRPMPGGALAIKEPWRMAVSYVFHAIHVQERDALLPAWMDALGLADSVGTTRIQGVLRMIEQGLNSPPTSSLGRLFDGVATLAGIRSSVAFEGQAAMELEMAMEDVDGTAIAAYAFDIDERDGRLIINPDNVIRGVVDDRSKGLATGLISRKFHTGVVQMAVEVCRRVRARSGVDIVALSGGCFQNRFLLERLSESLSDADFEVLTHSQAPANDGGLALGQAVIASYQLR